MNLTQWIMVLAPVALAYLLFVFLGESNGKKNIPLNAAVGLLFIPLFLPLVPFVLLSAGTDLVRKRSWGAASFVLILLLVIAGYGALVFDLRDPPPPDPHALPVERDAR